MEVESKLNKDEYLKPDGTQPSGREEVDQLLKKCLTWAGIVLERYASFCSVAVHMPMLEALLLVPLLVASFQTTSLTMFLGAALSRSLSSTRTRD